MKIVKIDTCTSEKCNGSYSYDTFKKLVASNSLQSGMKLEINQ